MGRQCLLLKLYKLQPIVPMSSSFLEYSLLLKLYKLQQENYVPGSGPQYSLLLKLYKLQLGGHFRAVQG